MLSREIPVKTARFFRSGNCLLTAFKVKRNRVVLLLSTQHKCGRFDDEIQKVPNTIESYNKTKCGADAADQMLRLYSTKAATRRWPLSVFYNLIDIVVLNASIIAKDLQFTNIRNRREFICAFIRKVCTSSTAIQSQPSLRSNESIEKRVRCQVCKTNKTKTKCQTCKKIVCGSCSIQLCKACFL